MSIDEFKFLNPAHNKPVINADSAETIVLPKHKVPAFTAQMDFLSDQCRANKPIDPARPVRVPGDAAARGIADAQKNGIDIDAATWAAIEMWADKLGVAAPQPAC